ncbi:hypothetical protein [Conexibacter sp. DBS9H8]|uniref:hypothetical protein n=1 Tax=Conexibacter sp. DBS9H8 TaxID=2937801 RepID=UPI00200FF094|nr:hypothetical protein [Conexibacter sp. DBS9H8]
MFAPRQLFTRTHSARVSVSTPASKAQEAARGPERHPAMRGIAVSPVHGHHCICGRCVRPGSGA